MDLLQNTDLAKIFTNISFHLSFDGVRVAWQGNYWRAMAPKGLMAVCKTDLNKLLEIPDGSASSLIGACNDFATKIWTLCQEPEERAFGFVWVDYFDELNGIIHTSRNTPFQMSGNALEASWPNQDWFRSTYPVPSSLQIAKTPAQLEAEIKARFKDPIPNQQEAKN